MNAYRVNIRFNLNDRRQRNAAEFLEHLDREKYISRSAFAVQAICAQVEEMQSGNPNARLLEDFRRILREELSTLSTAPADPPTDKPPELTQEQEARQEEAALAFLKGF